MALYEDAYTISAPRTGTTKIKDLSLSGWSNNSTWLEHGRLYWKKTTGDDLEFYRDEGYASGDKIVSGSINADGSVDLSTDPNGSGISGSAFVDHDTGEESTGEIIVTYCYEDDLKTLERDLLDFLDESNQFLGATRFEQSLRAGKSAIDRQLRVSLKEKFRRKNSNEVDLAGVAKPRQLAEAHARYTLYYIFLAVNNGDEQLMTLAELHRKEANKALDVSGLEIDYNNDDVIDRSAPATGGRLTR